MINSIYEEGRLAELAARYRLELDNRTEEEITLLTPVYKTLVLNQILKRFKGLEARHSQLLKSGDLNSFLKNLKTFTYAHFKNLTAYKQTIDANRVELFNDSSEVDKFYQKEIERFESVKKQLTKPGSSFYTRKVFEQRNLNESYDLLDLKRGEPFSKKSLVRLNTGFMSSTNRSNTKVIPLKAETFGASMSGSKEEKSSSTSFLWRKNKRFKYIVYKDERDNSVGSMPKGELNILFDFGLVNKINQLTIDEGSFFPLTFMTNKFLSYNETNDNWEPITIINEARYLKKTEIIFNEVSTRKIKVSFEQKKSLNKVSESFLSIDEKFNLEALNPSNSQENERNTYDVYDLSLDEVSFQYFEPEGKSIYREKKAIEVSELDFVALTDESIEQPFGFIESEIEVQAFQNENNWTSRIFKLPRSYKVRELVFSKGGVADITFPIKKDGDNYEIKALDLTLNQLNNLTISSVLDDEKSIGCHNISGAGATAFIVEYTTTDEIRYPDAVFKNGELRFNGELAGKKALLRPRYIFRTLGEKQNLCVVKKYQVEVNADSSEATRSARYRPLRSN